MKDCDEQRSRSIQRDTNRIKEGVGPNVLMLPEKSLHAQRK